MRYFLQAFSLSLKQQLRAWKVWAVMLLLPLLILGAKALLPEEETAAPVQVGVCLPEAGGDGFWQRLSTRSGTVVAFLQTDADTLTAKVASGQWDCGLVLAEDFDQRIDDLDTDGILTLYTSPASTVYPLVQETAASVIIELITPNVARDYAQGSGIPDPVGQFQSLDADSRVLIQLQTLHGGPLAVTALGQALGHRLLLGCLGLLLLIWALFSAMDLGSWFRSGPVKRMISLRSPAALLLPRAAGVLLPGLLSGLLCLALLGSSPVSYAGLLAYLWVLGAAALVLCRWTAAHTALPCLMPFMAAASLLFSPVVFDLSLLYPQLYDLSAWLPMTLFLNACGGSLPAMGLLLLEGTALFLLFLLTGKK